VKMEDVAESGGLALALLLARDVLRDRSMRWRHGGHDICTTVWWVFLSRLRLGCLCRWVHLHLHWSWNWYIIQRDESQTNPYSSSNSELGTGRRYTHQPFVRQLVCWSKRGDSSVGVEPVEGYCGGAWDARSRWDNDRDEGAGNAE
jgi:hypothetical protein